MFESKLRLVRAIRAGFGLLALSFAAAAQTGNDDPVEMIPVVDGDESVTWLGKTEVEGDASRYQDYLSPWSSTATKTETSILETPQSVTVITEARLQDFGAQSLQEALRYSAGVHSDAYGFDSRSDSATIRGTQFVQYQDGLRGLFGSFNNTRPDPYALQSVEILRGPSSVLYGQGSSGGMVNVSSKRPPLKPQHELRAEWGRFQRRQVAFDSGAPLTEDGALAYRLVGLHRESQTQVDYVRDDRWFIAPSLRWNPSDWWRWTVLGHFQEDQTGSTTAFLPWEGTIQPSRNGQIPTNRFVSEPDFDRYDTEQSAVTSLLEIGPFLGLSLHSSVRYVDSGANYNTLYPNIYTGDPYLLDPLRRQSVLRISYMSESDVQALTTDHRLSGHWRWGDFETRLLIGADVSRVETRSRNGTLTDPLQVIRQGTFNLYEPEYGRWIEPEVSEQPTLHTDQTGFYGQAQIKWAERVVALLGARRDEAVSETEGVSRIEDGQTSYRAGLLYTAAFGLSPYLSYSESFEPVASLNGDGAPYEPVRGRQYEFGLKFQPPSGATLITLSAFDLREENRLSPGPDPTIQIQLGEARVRGLEFEAATRIGRHWDLLAAYTWFDDAYSDEGPEAEDSERNKALPAVPTRTGSLWAKFNFSVLGLPGFSIGSGLRYTGAIPDQSRTVEAPSYTLWDAMLAYDSEHLRIAVNGSNLEDETVIAACLERGDCFYGARRSVVGSIEVRF